MDGTTYTEGDGNLTDNNDGTWTLIPAALADGIYDVTVTATDEYAAEVSIGNYDDVGQFTFSRGEGNTSGNLLIEYDVATEFPDAVIAEPGVDYTPSLSGMITIPAGKSSATINVTT